MNKVRWGVLSTAGIGMRQVLPAMQQGQYCEITAIASRSLDKAKAAAAQLGIPKAYGSYAELLADPDIDAVYNPMPNHLHVPWSIKALQAGKHVLCEKPIAMSAAEAQELASAARQYPKLKVMEAFMYRLHPQWQRAKQIVDDGGLGELRTIESHFSYFNDDPTNIRNQADIGGGGLMDIGCYNLSLSRFIFGEEPQRILGIVERDPQLQTDRLVSGILDFGRGTATFTCSTQLAGYQRANIFGTTGRVEIEIPFNAPKDRPTRLWHQHDGKTDEVVFNITDQYTIQGDLFSQAVLNDMPVPTPLSDAVANMRAIDAIFESGKRGGWVTM
jgi:predicted dehydrogenase